jgi:type I restriction enzyme M protein
VHRRTRNAVSITLQAVSELLIDTHRGVDCATTPRATTSERRRGASPTPRGAGAAFTYDELAKRDKLNLDIFWLKDTSLEDADSLPEPDALAQEIAEDLQAAMELFAAIANELKE